MRPNILLIVADDLGWSDLSAFGGEIADGIAKKRRPFSERDATDGIDYSNVTDLAGCETSTHLVDSPWKFIMRI